ncbi:MAG: xanthine dehydrogenase accessory protein XdhC [Pseudomonadota bacterium]
MSDWLTELKRLQERREAAVLVTVAGTRGSAPRDAGAKMVVTATQTTGTIGGGHLEHQCIQEACAWLQADEPEATDTRSLLRHFALGTQCGQCCGGVVDVLFETIDPQGAPWVDFLVSLERDGIVAAVLTPRQSQARASKCVVTAQSTQAFGPDFAWDPSAIAAARDSLDATSPHREAHQVGDVLVEPVKPFRFTVFLFGAGHVGSACAAVLSTLACDVQLIDSRPGFLEQDWPDNVTPIPAAEPERIVAAAPAQACFLVMTHDHALDLALCASILSRQDAAFCGLIGSRSKRRRFEKRLRALGINDEALARLTCPIGIDSIKGKRPTEIALAVAAQLQALHERNSNGALAQRDYGRVSR